MYKWTFSVIILFFNICMSYAEEVEVRDAVVLVIVQQAELKEDQYREVIENTVKIDLETAKLQVITDHGLNLDSNLMFRLAEEKKADFIVTGTYSVSNRLLQIEFTWYDVQFRKVSESVFERIVMDLEFDKSVSETVYQIIELMNERIKEFPLVVIEQPDVQENTEPEISEPEQNQETEKEYPEEVMEAHLNSFDWARPIQSFKNNYIEAAAGFSPFVSVARANEYFKIGFLPAVYVNYVFNLDFGCLGVGLFAGLNDFNVQSYGSEYDYLVPVGANVKYKTPFERRFNFSARISAGPSLLIVNFNSEVLKKVILYIYGSAGLEIEFTRIFGIIIEAGYYVFFEEEDPIMGFTPGLFMVFRI